MPRYAQNTTVNVDRSRVEVHKILRKHGASRVADAWEPGRAAIQFEINGRVARLSVPLPTKEDVAKRKYARKTPAGLKAAVEKEERQRWRALVLLLKAKLGRTVAESMREAIEAKLQTPALPARGET